MNRAEELTLKLADGLITEAEIQELEGLVANDPQAARTHLSLLDLEASLRGRRQDVDVTRETVERLQRLQAERIERGVMEQIRTRDAQADASRRPTRALRTSRLLRRQASLGESRSAPLQLWWIAGLAASILILVGVLSTREPAVPRGPIASRAPAGIPESSVGLDQAPDESLAKAPDASPPSDRGGVPKTPVVPPPPTVARTPDQAPRQSGRVPLASPPDLAAPPALAPVTPVAKGPAQPEPPAGKPSETVLARLDRVRGEARVVAGSDRIPARGGESLFTGQGVLTVGTDSLAIVEYTDGTRLELGADTAIGGLRDRQAQSPADARRGRSVDVAAGVLAAEVARQPSGQPMIFTTPHARITVLGTRFTVRVEHDLTRLEVREGRVRFMRLADGASVEVRSGHFATSASGATLASKPMASPARTFLSEDFTDPRAMEARWQFVPAGFPTSVAGGLMDIDVSPQPGGDYGAGGWHAGGGIRSRQTFPLPLRVSADVEITHRHENLLTLIVMIPASVRFGEVRNAVAVKLRGGLYGTLVENQEAESAEAKGSWPRRERWTAELDGAEVRFLVDDMEVLRRAHGLTLREPARVEFEAGGKEDVPDGAHVRFHKVRIEALER